MAEAHVDNPGEVRWFKGEGPARVVGPCAHDCKHLGQGVIAWGPSEERYELVECGLPGDGGCRAWIDGAGRVVTDWLTVAVDHSGP